MTVNNKNIKKLRGSINMMKDCKKQKIITGTLLSESKQHDSGKKKIHMYRDYRLIYSNAGLPYLHCNNSSESLGLNNYSIV